MRRDGEEKRWRREEKRREEKRREEKGREEKRDMCWTLSELTSQCRSPSCNTTHFISLYSSFSKV